MTSTHQQTSDISVIIPALNERPHIDRLALQLTGQVREMILVDGGSSDGTAGCAQACGFSVIESTPGRAEQMNRGAVQARGAILLFLHADTRLPDAFAKHITTALSDANTALCAFSLVIDTDSRLLSFIAAAANLRSRLAGLPYGDQALSLRKQTFDSLGGYPLLPIMEDYELVRKAARLGAVKTLEAAVRTSDRRWRRFGVVQTTLINQLVVAGFKVGVDPYRLALLYRNGLFGVR